MMIKHSLVKDEASVKEVILYVQTSSKREAVVNKILFEYRQYKDVLKKFEEGLSLSNYLENDYEIILKDVSKFRIGLIYNMSEK